MGEHVGTTLAWQVWFDYWDVNKDGHLSPEELIPALTAAYEVGDLGRQWIESYVNTHYP